MKVIVTLLLGATLLGACVPVTQTAPSGARPVAAAEPRERFTFPSTATRATLAYACRPGPQGGGTAARAEAAHASFDASLAGFAATQASAASAAIDRGLTGEALSAELGAAGDAFAAEQRARLDASYGCIPAGEA
ncbi:MAG: hypothetical protein ACRC6I_14120 [Paracoccaceae bacterium]